MSKWALLSKTIIGIIVTVAGAFGFSDVLPGDFAETFGAFVDNALVVFGAILAVIGRFTAEDKVTVLPKV